jgi:hypothetical protein
MSTPRCEATGHQHRSKKPAAAADWRGVAAQERAVSHGQNGCIVRECLQASKARDSSRAGAQATDKMSLRFMNTKSWVWQARSVWRAWCVPCAQCASACACACLSVMVSLSVRVFVCVGRAPVCSSVRGCLLLVLARANVSGGRGCCAARRRIQEPGACLHSHTEGGCAQARGGRPRRRAETGCPRVHCGSSCAAACDAVRRLWPAGHHSLGRRTHCTTPAELVHACDAAQCRANR